MNLTEMEPLVSLPIMKQIPMLETPIISAPPLYCFHQLAFFTATPLLISANHSLPQFSQKLAKYRLTVSSQAGVIPHRILNCVNDSDDDALIETHEDQRILEVQVSHIKQWYAEGISGGNSVRLAMSSLCKLTGGTVGLLCLTFLRPKLKTLEPYDLEWLVLNVKGHINSIVFGHRDVSILFPNRSKLKYVGINSMIIN